MSRAILYLLLCGVFGCSYRSVDSIGFSGGREPIRILFIGNSYTYFNGGVHRILSDMAQQRGRSIEVAACVAGGRSLAWHLLQPEARELIDRGGWDWVVLQDYSTHPFRQPEKFDESIREFDRLIRRRGARTALFMTWSRENEPTRQHVVAEAYGSIAAEIGATVVPCGLAWQRSRALHPRIALYQWDGSHPTYAGSYLAAGCFLAGLVREDPRGLAAPGLPPAVARTLQQVAWEVSRPAATAHP